MAIPKPFFVFCLLFLFHFADAQYPDPYFYAGTCPSLRSIVWDTTAKFIPQDKSLAPALLRMYFHDCFVRGCDASVLLHSPNRTAEKDAGPNQSLRGFHVIDAVKADVERKCPGKVSCADILALVARAAVMQIGGPSWNVPLGRRDGKVSSTNEALANLPPPFFNIKQLIASFTSKGLSVKDLVVLSGGGHTIGFSHCTSFATRLYNFKGTGDADPSMDPNYVAELKSACKPNDNTTLVGMDRRSSMTFDTNYFYNVKNGRGLFQSDVALLDNYETNKYVQFHSTTSFLFRFPDRVFLDDFAESMEKMGNIGVLTRDEGEIRKVCYAVN